jgi:hypothetical protein
MPFAKKILLIFFLFITSSVYSAQSYLQTMLSLETDRDKNTGTEYYEFVTGNKIGQWDFSTCFGTKEGSDNLEHRIKYTVDLIFVELYVQERLGYQWDTNRSLTYYTFDTGMSILLSDKHQHRIDILFRHKNSFEDEDEIQANRVGVELKRKITKTVYGGVAYMRSYGDKNVNTWRFTLTYKF